MKRTISGMIGAGSLAHNRRDFVAENVDPDRVQLNICYKNENLKEVYKELFDDAVERYNVGKRKDRQIANYYEKIRQGKQEKLFHEVIFQIGNREDMAVGTEEGDLAVKVLDVYVKDFQKRNPTLRVFSCYLHQDEATPHLHIDFIPYVTGWKGKGMDTRVSLKQALKSLGFQGGNKHDTELNQWINHEKEVLAEIAKQHGIEWEQKGTHEEHLDVYNFKKKERKKEVQELEQEKEYLTAENEGLTSQIADARADIKLLEEEKIQFQKDKETAEKLVNDIKELSDEEVELEINEKTTENLNELNINTLEVAKENIIETLNIDTTTEITNINGIKIATLPVSGTISSRYGVSSSIRSSKHTGLDIAANQGTQIKVVADGTVTCASYSGSYGYLVKVDHGNGVETWYAHTSKMYVKEGQEVKAGDVIALVGSTGNSTGPHLHFEVRINGEHVNPQNYLY